MRLSAETKLKVILNQPNELLTLPMNHFPPNTMLIHSDLMPVETCLSTLLSLVVGSVVEEEGWGGGRLYFESKHLISYNVKYLYDLIIALCTPRKKSFIIIYFNIYFFFLTQDINQVNMIANIVGFIFISTVLCHVQPITGPVIFTYFSLI